VTNTPLTGKELLARMKRANKQLVTFKGNPTRKTANMTASLPADKPDEVLAKARSKIWAEISNYEQRARNFRADSENFLTVLVNETGKYLNLGVAVVTKYEDQDWQNRLGQNKLQYLKDICKSLTISNGGRPWIYLSQDDGYTPGRRGWGSFWVLTVPKSNRLKNVVAGLLMVADDGVTEPFLVHIPHERKWVFQFYGAQGKEMKDHWLEQCADDSVFRLCMGLPPKVSFPQPYNERL